MSYKLLIVTSLLTFGSSEQDFCTVTSFCEIDKAVKLCGNIAIKGITVPEGKTLYLDLKPKTNVIFYGTITFAPYHWSGPLVHIFGNNVTLKGAQGSKFDGVGASYWDGLGDHGVKKPTFFKIETSDFSLLEHINIVNCPKQCVSVSSHHTILNEFNIEISLGNDVPKNTDGFDVSGSSFLLIQNSIVRNRDDCVAVNQGAHLKFDNLTCYGGHGLSLSVGFSPGYSYGNVVHDVVFSNSAVIKSRNGIHIKTHADGGRGFITNVTFQNIQFSDITRYGINIQQDYVKGHSTGNATSNIPITHLVIENVTGTMSGESESMSVYILCGDGACEIWDFINVDITNAASPGLCNYYPTGYEC